MNAFFLGVSAFMASMGRIADLYGRRKIFYMGTIIFMLASIGAGLAATPVFLIVCRALQGITTAITTEPLLRRAFERAQLVHPETGVERRVVVQEHVVGEDCRVLVVDQKYVFAIQRLPASVVGDGQQTVAQLVAAWNATRKKVCAIQLNEQAHELLADQHLTAASVPAVGQYVLLAYVSNYHAGGRLKEVTDELGLKIRQTALAVAAYFSLPLVGIDFMTPDHRHTVGIILELNGTPDITIHHFPDEGVKRDVARVIIDMLFPETAQP